MSARFKPGWLCLWLGAAIAMRTTVGLPAEPELVPVPVRFPLQAEVPTFMPPTYGPEIERPGPEGWPLPRVPKGSLNVAWGKPVSASTNFLHGTRAEQITDGGKGPRLESIAELNSGFQWVQVDLLERHEIQAIVIWHANYYFTVFRQVIVQVADDAEFTRNVRTLFNNDQKNEAGLGAGKDPQYVESRFGRIIKGDGQPAQYIRWYSHGCDTTTLNCRLEIEVYALPVTKTRPELVPLTVEYPDPGPAPTFPRAFGPEIERPGPKGWDLPLVPKGTINVALGKPVRVSTNLFGGTKAEYVTDGKSGYEADLPKGLQWVQVDLQGRYEIQAIAIWSGIVQTVFKQVIVRVADDPDFTRNARTLFNNDHNNEAGFGAGKDKQYSTSHYGRIIKGDGKPARYVRWYSHGCDVTAINIYEEMDVFALPVKIPEPELVPLPVKFPTPSMKGNADPIPDHPDFEPLPGRRPELPLVSKGVINVALGKPVKVSTNLWEGTRPEQVTDGEKEARDANRMIMKRGLQWVQVDLEGYFEIEAVVIWHDFGFGMPIYKQVIVQVADDGNFTRNVRTLFNNDRQNAAGLGAGKDLRYGEFWFGRIIKGDGKPARYVRWYSNGSSDSALNLRMEMEVYALPINRSQAVGQ